MADKTEQVAAPAMDVDAWYEKQFLPWKQALRQYFGEKQERLARLHQHVGQLQSVVALLLDGRNKQALLAWNTLKLHPHLVAISLAADGETIILTEDSRKESRLNVDEVLVELEALLRERGVNEAAA